jgi:ribosomal protein S18 acetylase RimI-like enzyme
MLRIRAAEAGDVEALWAIIEPVLRAGETYALPRDWSRNQAIEYWLAPPHQVFVAEEDSDGRVVGTYFLTPNQAGGGSHAANCGFMTAADSSGRGIGRAMCAHALELAKSQGFRAMQFNFVVSTNTRAVALWESFGFAVLARLPGAFLHPVQGYVDALLLYRTL